MNAALKKLYQEVILAHNAKPFHYEKKEGTAVDLEANNPLCGDRFTLYLDLDNDRITTAHFYGFGCAISKASTSILIQHLEGKTVAEAKNICGSFLQYIDNENRDSVADKDFAAFAAVDEFPARKDCAILAWQALNNYLEKK